MRKWIAGGVLAVSIVGMGSTAFAGEGTGSGKGGPDKERPGVTGAVLDIFLGEGAQSICAFSGLEDGEEDPTGPSGPGTTQNWGQIPHAVRQQLPAEEHPGNACNGSRGIVAQVTGG